MSVRVFYPYPRLAAGAVDWGAWGATVDGRRVALDAIVDEWDSLSELRFSLDVSLTPAALADVGARDPRLVVTVSCRDAALSRVAEARFIRDSSQASASVTVQLHGSEVSERLELRASIIDLAVPPENPWLARRVVADRAPVTVPLESELVGFPTVSYSFDSRSIPAAPWRLVVAADSADDAFSNSIRLELNEDYPMVVDLMEGRGDAFLEVELASSITRVLLATVARLMREGGESVSAQSVAADYPESLAAAAERAAVQYLKMPLNDALRLCERQPERFESAVATGVGLLKERR